MLTPVGFAERHRLPPGVGRHREISAELRAENFAELVAIRRSAEDEFFCKRAGQFRDAKHRAAQSPRPQSGLRGVGDGPNFLREGFAAGR